MTFQLTLLNALTKSSLITSVGTLHLCQVSANSRALMKFSYIDLPWIKLVRFGLMLMLISFYRQVVNNLPMILTLQFCKEMGWGSIGVVVFFSLGGG